MLFVPYTYQFDTLPQLHAHAVGNIGGFIGPWLTGLMVDKTHSYAMPAVMMGTCLAGAGAMVLLMPRVLRMPATLSTAASRGKL